MSLTFYYGLMNTGKSNHLVSSFFSWRESDPTLRIKVFAAALDTRVEENVVSCQMPTRLAVNVRVDPETNLMTEGAEMDLIFFDEAQFATVDQIDQLRRLADAGVRVQCYGLMTDWKLNLFPGSQRLVEVADTIHQIQLAPAMCQKCKIRRAIGHGKLGTTDNQVEIGRLGNLYWWTCFSCSGKPATSSALRAPLGVDDQLRLA